MEPDGGLMGLLQVWLTEGSMLTGRRLVCGRSLSDWEQFTKSALPSSAAVDGFNPLDDPGSQLIPRVPGLPVEHVSCSVEKHLAIMPVPPAAPNHLVPCLIAVLP